MVQVDERQEVLDAFRSSPAGFATRVLGVGPKLHQVVILNSIRDNRRTLVVSCNSIGKDFIAGVATHWWLQIWDEALVITTAPTGLQVKSIQWKEIRHLWLNAKLPLGGTMPDVEPSYRIGSKRSAIGIATREEPERIQGHHEKHILIIVTEGSAVSEDVYLGIRALMASGDVKLLVLTNPTRNDGEVWEICQRNRAGWNIINVDGWDLPNLKACQELGDDHMNLTVEELEERNECPNPTPYLMTHIFEAETAQDFGTESDYYTVHVRGRHGTTGRDQLIPREWVDLAYDREPVLTGERGGGLDIARSGADSTAYAEVSGDAITRLEEWKKLEVTQTEGKMRADVLAAEPNLAVAVDDTGLGGGVAPHLRETHKRVFGIDFSEKAQDEIRFANKPAEMYFRLRKRLDPDGEHPLSLKYVARELRKKLTKQLIQPIFNTNDSKGRLKVDKHGEGGPSPDMVDAIILALEAQAKYLWSGLKIDNQPTRDVRDQDPDAIKGRAQFAGIRNRTF